MTWFLTWVLAMSLMTAIFAILSSNQVEIPLAAVAAGAVAVTSYAELAARRERP